MAGVAGMVTASLDGATVFGLRLRHLHPLRDGRAATDLAYLLAALQHHVDARVVLQIVAWPDVARPHLGTLEITLLVVTDGDETRADELADDLLDLLDLPPRRWTFEPITDPDGLARALAPIEATHLAEIARDESPCPPEGYVGGVGFVAGDRQAIESRLWCPSALGPPSDDLRSLAAILLAQDAPVAERVVVTPTVLTDDERIELQHLVTETRPGLVDDSVPARALQLLEGLLHQRPLFTVRCLVAGAEPLRHALLSSIGFAASRPPATSPDVPVLQGGHAVLRPDATAGDDLATVWSGLDLPAPAPTLAPGALRRLRSLMGVWEAATLFRLPVADDRPFPGLEVLDVPSLEASVADLPTSGRVLGHLIGQGGLAVRIDEEDAFRHTYVVGQTGTGKSTLLLDLALQDIERGDGVAVLDPHGDLVDAVLERIPPERIDDVVLIDPADPIAVVGVNLLEADSAVQAGYLVEELGNMFQSMFDPRNEGIVGPRFTTMLRQAAQLLMDSPVPASMLDIATVFNDPAVRKHLVSRLTDPIQLEYWEGDMANAAQSREFGEVVSWFRSKFEIFRTSPLVRNVVGQADSTISFTDVLDQQRILLVDLSKGTLGEYNSALIGRIVFARLWAAALSRATLPREMRQPFHVYIDEFQNMTSESLPAVLSEARKFRLGLTLANQFFTQIPEATRDALMGNVGSRLTFRLGPLDAPAFATWLGPQVAAQDLTHLPNFVGVAALSGRGVPIDPCVVRTNGSPPTRGSEWAEQVRQRSREQWARPVAGLDDAFFQRWSGVPGSYAAKAASRPSAGAPGGPRTLGSTSASDPAKPSFLDEWLAKRKKKQPGGPGEDGTTNAADEGPQGSSGAPADDEHAAEEET